MIYEKILIIGISLVNYLIERYDRGDSAISFSDIIIDINNNYYFAPTHDEIYEIINLLNKSCSRHDVLKIIYLSDMPMLFEPVIITERSEHYLAEIKEQLQEELNNLSTIF